MIIQGCKVKPIEVRQTIQGRKVEPIEIRQRMTEHHMQTYVFDVLTLLGMKFPILNSIYAIPNGAKLPYGKTKSGKRFSRQANHLKEEGLRPGIPDICVPYSNGTYSALYIEMKRPGGKTSDSQTDMQSLLSDLGNRVVTHYSIADVLREIRDYTSARLNQVESLNALTLLEGFDFYIQHFT